MRSFDFFPAKCNFSNLEKASFFITGEEPIRTGSKAHISITHLGKMIHAESHILNKDSQRWHLPLSIKKQPFDELECGFFVTCVLSMEGQKEKYLYSAFDCSANWANHPRYGFLSDFPPDHKGVSETIEELSKFHINGLQFYDWQYRHEKLVADKKEYKDVLGRSLSLEIIKELIDLAHQSGIACMPYLAIYGASLSYWNSHQDDALFNINGKPISFHGFLGIMNPAPNSNWINRLSAECDKTLEKIPFNGLHIDQYGEPQTGYDSTGKKVDLPNAFVDFINTQKKKFSGKTVVFNAVKNWPIEALCSSTQDFVYIEIWPPKVHYRDLIDIIRNAQQLSGNKPVVLALYIPAKRTANICLTNAVILACGASHIEIGENARYLSDPYFPKHQKMSSSLYNHLRRYYDFAVAYREWLKPTKEILHKEEINAPSDVAILTNDCGENKIIHLINFSKLEEKRWNKQHPSPETIRDFNIEILCPEDVKAVFVATPDNQSAHLKATDFLQTGEKIKITVPRLKYWTMIMIETETK